MAESNDTLMAYAMGQDNGRNNGGGWGGFGDGWMGLIAFAMIFGWGGNGGWGGGFGGGGYGGGYPVESILQRSLDTQTIIGKLDGLNNGLCDGFYAQNNAINAVGTTVMQTAAQAELARCNSQAQLMQQLNTMAYQQKDCCCETQRLVERIGCDAAYAASTNTANIIQAHHNDTDRVIARLDAMESARKDELIASLRAEVQDLQRSASQDRQNAYLTTLSTEQTAQIRAMFAQQFPAPVPAWQVNPPFPYNYNGQGQCGSCNNNCNSGCGF